MNIAIIGTRGIPNHYGGFEQFAEFVSVALVEKGHTVSVYNSHKHPYQDKTYQGVKIIHCKDPEDKIGTAGQFLYDLNCIRDARKRNFDIILQLGYTSSSIWHWLMPKKAIVTTNMDGLEWKRTKFSRPIQKFIKYAEKLAVRHSDHLIADSIGIQSYLDKEYKKQSTYIPYGAEILKEIESSILKTYDLEAYQYNLLVARLEPENSIELILEGHKKSESKFPMIVIGKTATPLGQKLINLYSKDDSVIFLGGVYDQHVLNNLRYFSNVYFHGHTVGGTNPSLLEAMGCSALICAHGNEFNSAILDEDAFYFDSLSSIVPLFSISKSANEHKVKSNLDKIASRYSWERITNDYIEHFEEIKSNF